jgi:hypothetical protein
MKTRATIGRVSAWVIAGVFTFACASAARAAVTLAGGPSDSFIKAVAQDNLASPLVQDTKPITAIPSNPIATATAQFAGSTVAGSLSDTSLTFQLAHNNPGNGGLTQGLGTVVFTSSTDVTYNLTGTFSSQEVTFITFGADEGVAQGVAIANEVILSAKLVDRTTDQTLYSDQKGGFFGSTLNLSSGTGTLVAGHVYEFDFSSSMQLALDPQGGGQVALNLAPVLIPPGGGGGNPVPLPAAAWAGITTGAVAIRSARRRISRRLVC